MEVETRGPDLDLYLPRAGFAAWRGSLEETPAGGMTGTGIHVLDALARIAGPVRRTHTQLLSLKPGPDPWDSLSVMLEFVSMGMRPSS